MTTESDISITYNNNSGSDDDQSVVVFSKNFSTNAPQAYYVAWQVLCGKPSQKFVYPATTCVGATDDEKNLVGPVDAEPGSTWEINHENKEDSATLKGLCVSYVCTWI